LEHLPHLYMGIDVMALAERYGTLAAPFVSATPYQVQLVRKDEVRK
jgi:hypothetical protein